MINILQEAQDIVYNDKDEHDYGSFDQNMQDACNFAMVMTGKMVDIDMAFAILVGLKLAREKQNHKIDNMIDVCGYMAGWADFKQRVAWAEMKNKETEDGNKDRDQDGREERSGVSLPISELP